MGEARCWGCGEGFVSAVPERARWCSARCRKRAQRGRVAVVVPAGGEWARAGAGEVPAEWVGPVERAVRGDVGRLVSTSMMFGSLAAAAVGLARRIDRGGGSAEWVGVCRELRHTLAEVVREAVVS